MNMEKSIDYAKNTVFFKALSDENRLKIMDMLSGGEICACEILDELEITQPTLSHHMKILCGCTLVVPRREGKWTYYSLNKAAVKRMNTFIAAIISKKEAKIPIRKKECCE